MPTDLKKTCTKVSTKALAHAIAYVRTWLIYSAWNQTDETTLFPNLETLRGGANTAAFILSLNYIGAYAHAIAHLEHSHSHGDHEHSHDDRECPHDTNNDSHSDSCITRFIKKDFPVITIITLNCINDYYQFKSLNNTMSFWALFSFQIMNNTFIEGRHLKEHAEGTIIKFMTESTETDAAKNITSKSTLLKIFIANLCIHIPAAFLFANRIEDNALMYICVFCGAFSEALEHTDDWLTAPAKLIDYVDNIGSSVDSLPKILTMSVSAPLLGIAAASATVVYLLTFMDNNPEENILCSLWIAYVYISIAGEFANGYANHINRLGNELDKRGSRIIKWCRGSSPKNGSEQFLLAGDKKPHYDEVGHKAEQQNKTLNYLEDSSGTHHIDIGEVKDEAEADITLKTGMTS
jgi:hypothetical protein